MKATDFISKITNFMNFEKEVFVCLYSRDSDGNVISKEVFPVSNVFAHKHDEVKICIEAIDRKVIDCN